MTTHAQELRSNTVELLEGLHVKEELLRAKQAASKLADQAIEAGQSHPKTAAAVLLGTGALLGSLVYRLIAPRPTATQLIAKNLQRGAANAGRSLRNGLSTARKLVV